MSGSDRDLHADDVRAGLAGAPGASSGDQHVGDDGSVQRAVSDVKRSIDQVADKVKGLLRSGR